MDSHSSALEQMLLVGTAYFMTLLGIVTTAASGYLERRNGREQRFPGRGKAEVYIQELRDAPPQRMKGVFHEPLTQSRCNNGYFGNRLKTTTVLSPLPSTSHNNTLS